MRSCRALHALPLLCLLLLPAYAQESRSARTSAQLGRLQSRLQELADAFPGVMGVTVRDIKTGEEVSINGDRPFPMASVYKIPIMVEVFRQIEAKKFSLDDRIELGNDHRTLGSGVLTLLSNGLRPTIKDLVTLMIVLSDNEATDILLKKAGTENVTAAMRSMGLNNIRVDRTTFELIRDYVSFMDENARGKTYREIIAAPRTRQVTPEKQAEAEREFAKVMKDVSSPRDMALLLEKIYKGEAASKESCRMMMTILGQQMFDQRLPRYLPESARMAHKTGTIGSTTNDAGIMFVRGNPIAITVFTVDKRAARGEVEERMGRLTRVVYDFFDAVK
ncbi:MAG: serine hydrolase [Blastocatellales bacterium]